MTRRKVLSSAAAGAAGAAQAQTAAARHYLLLRKFYLRNGADNQQAQLTGFLEKSAVPAIQKSGAAGVGVFASQLAPDSPFILMVVSFPTLAAYEEGMAKMAADGAYQAALKAFNTAPGQRFVRYETSLLRGFAGFPQLAKGSGKNGRLFELRTYESDDATTLAEKIRMFNEGEIAIFQKTGLDPVFFGETVFGQKQPNLTYMLGYDDWNARDANWKKFIGHPEWAKLRSTPGWSDAEIVSNISSVFLRALPFSPVR